MGFQGWSPPGFPAGCCQERHRTCGTWWDAARCSPQPFPARGPGVRMLLARLERPKLVCCRWRSCHLELFPPGGQTPPIPPASFPIEAGLLASLQIILAAASPTNGTISAPASLPRCLHRAVVLRGCFWGAFQHPTRVQEVCGWHGHSLLRTAPLLREARAPARRVFCSRWPWLAGLTSFLLIICPSPPGCAERPESNEADGAGDQTRLPGAGHQRLHRPPGQLGDAAGLQEIHPGGAPDR